MNSDLLTVILTSGSCAVFFLVMLTLMVTAYRKDPLCCRFRSYRTEEYTNDLPHYNSRHSLIGIAHNAHSAPLNQRAIGPQEPQLPGTLFIIGKPNDYHLTGPLPRLPSYESVRKEDRQRNIQSMIAQRFDLSGSHDEPPPTYEETFYPTLQASPTNVQSVDVHLSIQTYDESPHSSGKILSP
ncbi:hypothetical protein CHARACLAT_026803 [Characodon lateralis]|uniref:Uncharacterized protein n=1 Tax=Characodon lateralis TaxID=208331 RepID=A0ABU7EZL2_9TELE|nr:hypothetical protein [Characodon lateralis]